MREFDSHRRLSVPFRLPADAPRAPLTRFAPAPTGFLHLGHAASAVWVWGVARALDGRVLLRIEDHDRGRSRPEYAQALLDDLDWLGLEPDSSVARQSARGDVYQRELDRLALAGLVFGCDCSRRRLDEAMAPQPNQEARYDGRCRARGLVPGPGVGTRVRIEPGIESFADLRLGPQIQDPSAQCGDVLARDRTGNWTYQFAVTADDRLQQVSLVVRGEDLLASTGRQLRLARLLGREVPPRFLHHPLILGPAGAKLSKANRDTGLRDLRAAGWTPAQVLGAAAHATGLLDRPLDLTARDLGDLFAGGDSPGL